jgi:hypothetical protein
MIELLKKSTFIMPRLAKLSDCVWLTTLHKKVITRTLLIRGTLRAFYAVVLNEI